MKKLFILWLVAAAGCLAQVSPKKECVQRVLTAVPHIYVTCTEGGNEVRTQADQPAPTRRWWALSQEGQSRTNEVKEQDQLPAPSGKGVLMFNGETFSAGGGIEERPAKHCGTKYYLFRVACGGSGITVQFRNVKGPTVHIVRVVLGERLERVFISRPDDLSLEIPFVEEGDIGEISVKRLSVTAEDKTR